MTTQAPIYNAIKQGAWQHKEQWEHWASLFHCAVVPMNDLALSLIKDAHTELKKSPRYKQMVKKNAKAAERAGEEYERMLYLEAELNRYGDRRMFLMDYMDSWQANMKHDIDIFAFSISRYLKKLGYDKENTLMTLVFEAHVMVEYACQLWELFWAECKRKTGKDMSGLYKPAKLTSVYNYWAEVSQAFDPHNLINLDDDKDCRLAFDIIQRKATSSESINIAGEQALDLNDDVREWADNKDKTDEEERKKYIGMR